MGRFASMEILNKAVFIKRIPVGGIKVERAFRDEQYVVLHLKGNCVAILRESSIPKVGYHYPLRPASQHWQRAILGILHKIGIASKKDIDREVTRKLNDAAKEKCKWDQEQLDELANKYKFKSPKLKPAQS